jgi:hypothetical protein
MSMDESSGGLTPEQRSFRSRMAAHALHAKVKDPTAHTQPARDAFLARFLREVDPEGTLPDEERRRRALHARTAYMHGLALKSVKSRARRARD